MTTDLVSILLTSDALAEMKAAEVEAQGLARLEALPVDERIYGIILGQVQTKIADIEKLRLTISQPMHEAKKAVDALFAKAAAPYKATKELLKDRLEKVLTERATTERLAREAHQRLLAAQVAANVPVTALAPVPLPPTPVVPNSSTSFEWEWDLLDIASVPQEFLALNHATMKGYANKYKKSETIPEIPGIAFRRVAKVTARQG